MEKNHDHNPGVKCLVNTCHYYCQGDHCDAPKIEVQHRNATSSKETDCATFKPQQNMSSMS